MFWLESVGARLVLSGLSLRNGRYEFGGAVLNKGSLVLDRVNLSSNASPNNGAALLNTGEVYGFSTRFVDNRAAGDGFGGGIFNERGTVQLYATTFTGNRANHSGGGIYNDQRNELRVTASLLDGNVAKGEMLQAAGGFGGGIHNESKLYLTARPSRPTRRAGAGAASR